MPRHACRVRDFIYKTPVNQLHSLASSALLEQMKAVNLGLKGGQLFTPSRLAINVRTSNVQFVKAMILEWHTLPLQFPPQMRPTHLETL